MLTQLTPSALPGQRYGSFSGKEEADEPAGPHNPGTITQLMPFAVSGQRYAFVAKSESAEPEPPPVRSIIQGAGGEFESWEDYVKAEFRRKHLLKELVREEKKLKKVEKQIKEVEKKVAEKRTEGILANLLKLEFKKDEIQHRINALEIEMVPLEMFLEAEIDEDDDEIMQLLQ